MMTDTARLVEHGRVLAIEAGRQEPTLRDAIWELMMEAAATLRRLPDREIGWLKAAERSNMPEYLHEREEIFAAAVARGGQYEAPKVRMGPPDAAAIDRMDAMLAMLNVITGRDRRREIGVVFALASGLPVRIIRFRFGYQRSAIYKIRDRGLDKIEQHVTAQMKRAA